MIIGRDLLTHLGINLKFSSRTVEWDGIAIPMRPVQMPEADFINWQDKELQEELCAAVKILDANYKKADINETVGGYKHLSEKQRSKLKSLLYRYKELFDGTLGDWKTDPVNVQLKEGARPFNMKPYPVPHIHIKTLKKEID